MPPPRSASRTYSRRSLHGQVAYDIGVRIMRGDISPGEVLPNEADFSVQFAVSRTALREAMKVLAAKGMVESRPKTGTRVRPRNEWNMLDPDLLAWQFATSPVERFAQDLFEIRQIIEPAAAAMAARRGTPEHLAEISAACEAMAAAAPDPEATLDPDLRFHQAILAASENELLRPMGALIESALATSIKISSSYPGALEVSVPRHKAVRDAIVARDPAGARAAMLILLDEAIDDLHKVVAAHDSATKHADGETAPVPLP